jgi:hypothetical protein
MTNSLYPSSAATEAKECRNVCKVTPLIFAALQARANALKWTPILGPAA